MSGVKDILQEYDRLGSFEQALLQLLSIIYEPAHTTLIVNCLKKLDLKGPRGNRPTTPFVNHYIAKLEKGGFVDDKRQVHAELVEIISRKAFDKQRFSTYASVVQKEAPAAYYYGKWSTRCWRAVRELRIGIYTQNFELIDQALSFLDNQCQELPFGVPPVIQIVARPFDRSWFGSLPPSLQFFLLNYIVRFALDNLLPFPEVSEYLEDEAGFRHLGEDELLPFQRLLLNLYLFQGRIDKASELLERNDDIGTATGSAGTLAFLKGDYQAAQRLFDDDLDRLKSINKTDASAFFGPQGLFHVLSSLAPGDSAALDRAARQISIALSVFEESEEHHCYLFLNAVVEHLLKQDGQQEITLPIDAARSAPTVLFAALAQFWLTGKLEADLAGLTASLHVKAKENSYGLLAIGFGQILIKTGKHGDYAAACDRLQKQTGIQPFIDLIEPEEPWKRSLQALINISTDGVQTQTDRDRRLIWLVQYDKKKLTVKPREQKRLPTSDWSRGRPISLARLHGASQLPFVSLQDRKICLAIRKTDSGEGQPQFSFNNDRLLTALVGHPLLFLNDSPTTPVEFIAGEPELLVEHVGEELQINFSIPISAENTVLIRETLTRFKVLKISQNHRRVASITGRDGLRVPLEASEEVLTAIGNIASFMTVHSAIGVDRSSRQAKDIQFVEADSTIHLHMLPYGSGFRLEMLVKPFRDSSHYVKPGQGAENIMAEIGGQRIQTRRNLAEEEAKAREVEELCPILDLAVDLEQENDREWHLQDPEDCLQALHELQAIGDTVVIEWPEGEKLNIAHQAALSNLNLKIRTNRQNWFSLSGELVLDQDLVLDLKDILQRIRNTRGRFIELDDGQFIALSREFRRRLDELNAVAEESDEDGGEITVHPLAAHTLEKLVEQANAKTDRPWRDQIARIKQAQSFIPELPSTLRAELRDYQLEGYRWLARLSRWGVGGCLADDMGLGKTLQSLAIILLNAARGPSLVVAPTSVSTNWLSEVSRFTPTLNIRQLTGRDRQETIQRLTKFDLLITTYTLLQQEIDALSQVEWQTIVLDEAQAIKNAATKRSQAAMSLQGAFRLITTGTPLENHLGELWNLFQFINPGLLGSHRQFNERFAIPIERFNNRDARLRLKKLIRPFILRRIKSQVLEELPPRTEVTLEVTMSRDELHFYEALRQNALDQLEQSTDNRGKHLQVLTEIMRLRQACCNPRLIASDTNIQSSKLEVFASLIDELIGGRHKVLVFSQFIGHLDIIRKYLDAQAITYQYLDGSTSARQRKERVEAFQSGQGDLFLISLKAGGLGLNLTAADYVIHMDPWWNPAVEDQASDRAHRIGQTRPVTIYRLVCKHTIEEKIVQLHQEKRDLADSLLEGTDVSGRLSTQELIDLIREN